MKKIIISVVIFLEDYIVCGMVQHFEGATLDSLLEVENDKFLEVKNAQIFSAPDSRELYSLSHLEVHKARVLLMFRQDDIISQAS